MSVRIFITGGTFDKEYDEITGKVVLPGHSYGRDTGAWQI